MLTVSEVAELLKVSYDTALNMVKFGGLPYVTIGRQYRIFEKDLENYINRKKMIKK